MYGTGDWMRREWKRKRQEEAGQYLHHHQDLTGVEGVEPVEDEAREWTTEQLPMTHDEGQLGWVRWWGEERGTGLMK